MLKQLKEDVEFGFEKALNQRGISSSLMFEVVSFWNWVLEEGLEDWDEEGKLKIKMHGQQLNDSLLEAAFNMLKGVKQNNYI